MIRSIALDETKAEVRLQFKDCPKGPWSSLGSNETVIEIQPHESVRLKVNINQPGLTLQPVSTELNLTYGPEALGGEELTEAYESLILDALSGDFSLSIRKEELEALWEICTPLLDHIDSHEDIELAGYTYGMLVSDFTVSRRRTYVLIRFTRSRLTRSVLRTRQKVVSGKILSPFADVGLCTLRTQVFAQNYHYK